MEIIYAIYKENIIPLVGGVNPDGIEIGLIDYNDWKLCAMQESEFNKFSEFRLYPVPKSIAVGLVLAGRSNYVGVEGDVAGNRPAHVAAQSNVDLSAEERELVRLAKDYMKKLDLKFITRAKVRQFKDFEDDLSDTKLLVEFLLGYIVEDYSTKTAEEKDQYPIKDLMNSFVQSFGGKDLRINNTKILGKVSQIIKDESFISRIVKSNYVEKLNTVG